MNIDFQKQIKAVCIIAEKENPEYQHILHFDAAYDLGFKYEIREVNNVYPRGITFSSNYGLVRANLNHDGHIQLHNDDIEFTKSILDITYSIGNSLQLVCNKFNEVN